MVQSQILIESGDAKDMEPKRHCLVTVGATAPFTSLLEEVLSAKFVQTLIDLGFGTMVLQTGSQDALAARDLAMAHHTVLKGLRITIEPYIMNMSQHIKACCGVVGKRPAGLVIAHGGKFSSRSHFDMTKSLLE